MQLKWLHLRGQNNQMVGTKRNESRVYGMSNRSRPDEGINSLDSGRTMSNFIEDFKINESEQSMVRRTEKFYSELWWDLAWTKFTKNLYRLQRRVYAAIRAKDFKKAKNLQKLILKSRGARFLAIPVDGQVFP